MNKREKQTWRLTGLWAKDLPSGSRVLSAKVQVQALIDTLQQVADAGLHQVEVEVWEAREAGDRKPTHNLRLTEPFQPTGQRQAGPTWAGQQDSPPVAAGEPYPF